MRYKHFTLTFALAFAPIILMAQFGFERNNSVEVIKTSIAQEYAWVGGLDYCQFSTIDLDSDGVEDLFIFDRTCNKILTFLQKGGIGETDYEYAPEYEKYFPQGLHDWTLLVDYNCDGKKDIFTYRLGGCSVFENTGTDELGLSFDLVKPILRTDIYESETYMFFGSQDIPAIVDIDGDGDKDILGFGVLGRALVYQKNLSMELYGTCDSLKFETKNICWGKFQESNSTNEVVLYDTLSYPCRSTDLTEEFPLGETPIDNPDRHAGSTVLALDMNNSGVMDVVLGDISFNNLTLLMNAGTEVNTDSPMNSQENNFPSTSTSVDLPLFPGAYHVDLNNDGIRDLLVSPNSKVGSHNFKSVWKYVNNGADLSPDFDFEEEDFLQGGMIDVGSSSLPVFFDHNGDGLKDLLVSSLGQYNPISGNPISKIAYYENIGTAELPMFEFITDDYQGLSTKGIGTTLLFYPTFGDLDGDGDEDMILGEYSGYCYYMQNTGGAGNPAIFNTFITLANGDSELIFAGTYVYPNLIDLDRDGDKDLVIGRRNGTLQYYENTGVGTYRFDEITSNLGNVDVSGAGLIEGHAIVQFVDVDDEYHLIVGSKRGYVYYYDDIEGNLEGDFHLVDSTLDNIEIGTYSAPAVYNLIDNNRLEMVLGNKRGGLVFFQSAPTTNIGLSNIDDWNTINIFPNPANDYLIIDLGSISANDLKQTEISLYSLVGQLIYKTKPTANTINLNLENLSKGTYLIQINQSNTSIKKKIIIQ